MPRRDVPSGVAGAEGDEHGVYRRARYTLGKQGVPEYGSIGGRACHQEDSMTQIVGIVGGTGPLGQGLAVRFASAGIDVLLGSRDPARAAAAALDVTDLADGDGMVTGVVNAEVAAADVVVLAVPFEGLEATVPPMAAALDGRIVVSAVNPLGFDAAGPHPIAMPEGSAAEAIAGWLPGARVTAAFHTLSGRELKDVSQVLSDDVPVVGDDDDAITTVVELADRIPGLRGVAVGPLRLSATLEGLIAVLISINRRHNAHVGVRFSRL